MPAKNKRLLKMQQLSHATGVSGGTIRYYVQKGILPKPLKTHRNMAYYDESYIERIRAIKDLQKKRFLPLSVIKMIVGAQGPALNGEQRQLLREMDRPLFEDSLLGDDAQPMSREELCERTGVEPKQIQALESMGMIETDAEGRFDPECVQIVEILSEIKEIGLNEELDFQVEHLQIHLDLMEFLARKEIEIFTKRIVRKGMSPAQIQRLAQDAIHALNKILPILHRRMVRRITQELG
jgi:DNA-binding transcriptional MerR regulator